MGGTIKLAVILVILALFVACTTQISEDNYVGKADQALNVKKGMPAVTIGEKPETYEKLVEFNEEAPVIETVEAPQHNSLIKNKLSQWGYEAAREIEAPKNFNIHSTEDSLIITGEHDGKAYTNIINPKPDSFALNINGQTIPVKKKTAQTLKKSYIIELKDPPLIQQADKSLLKQLSLSAKHDKVKGKLNNIDKVPVIATGNAVKAVDVKEEYFHVFNGIKADFHPDKLAEIEAMEEVKKVHEDKPVYANLADSVPIIGADEVWQLLDLNGVPVTGEGITIAVIDTGVDYTHPDLGGCFGAGCKVVDGYDFVNNDADPMDDAGHGTHCAATAAGSGTLEGVAPDATIYAYKVLDEYGNGWNSDIIAAIERAVDPDNNGDTSDHVDIISLSLGAYGADPDAPTSLAIDNAAAAGVISAVAASNDGPFDNSIGTPAAARTAVTVGAMSKDYEIASFSSRGFVRTDTELLIKPEIVAPGVAICAAQYGDWLSSHACLDDEHIAIDGTSMATPHVAGALALLKQMHPDWSVEQLKSAIVNTANTIGWELRAEGNGLVDVPEAITAEAFFLPQTLGMKITDDYEFTKDITITNDGDTELTFIVEHGTGSLLSIPSSVVIPPNNSTTIIANFTFNNSYGIVEDTINFTSSSQKYTIPIYLERLITVNIKVTQDGFLKRGFVDLLSEDISERYDEAEFRPDGLTAKFEVVEGSYVFIAASDFNELPHYMLSHAFETGGADVIDIELRLEDARPVTFMARSKDNEELMLGEWVRKFYLYTEEQGFMQTYSDPIFGDQVVYMNNKPEGDFNIDTFFSYKGAVQ